MRPGSGTFCSSETMSCSLCRLVRHGLSLWLLHIWRAASSGMLIKGRRQTGKPLGTVHMTRLGACLGSVTSSSVTTSSVIIIISSSSALPSHCLLALPSLMAWLGHGRSSGSIVHLIPAARGDPPHELRPWRQLAS